jgi:hypothetical protein
VSFVENFSEAGWLRMGGLFPPDLIDSLREEAERQVDGLMEHQLGHRGYLRVGDERVMLSVKLQGPFLDPQVYANPILLTLLSHLLGPDLVIDSYTCVIAMPGAGEQSLHNDHPALFPVRPAVEADLPPYAITVVIPLIDLTPETGTTRLFPGTHSGVEESNPELPYVGRGDSFLFDYRLRHQGTANNSATARPVLYVSYARPWFTDVVNFKRQPRINIDRDGVRKIPAEHWPLFRRVAGKGAIDLSEKELFREDEG